MSKESVEQKSQDIIDQLHKKIKYLERENNRFRLQRQQQEKLADINSKLLIHNNKELEKALELAEQANRAKTDFLTNISHEIRTPLTAILGLSEVISATRLDNFQQQQLRRLSLAGQQLLEILNNVLEISSIDSGGLSSRESLFPLMRC